MDGVVSQKHFAQIIIRGKYMSENEISKSVLISISYLTRTLN